MFVSYEEKKPTGFINKLGHNIIWVKLLVSCKFDISKSTKYLKNGAISTFPSGFTA